MCKCLCACVLISYAILPQLRIFSLNIWVASAVEANCDMMALPILNNLKVHVKFVQHFDENMLSRESKDISLYGANLNRFYAPHNQTNNH